MELIRTSTLILPLQPLQHSPYNQRQPDCRIYEHFAEFSAFFLRHELAPRHGFAVRTARQSTPVHRFRTNPQAIVIALERQIFTAAAMAQLDERPELLRPVARHAATDSEDAESRLFEQRLGEELQ